MTAEMHFRDSNRPFCNRNRSFYGHLRLYSSDESVFQGKNSTLAGRNSTKFTFLPSRRRRQLPFLAFGPVAAEHNAEGALGCPHIYLASYTHPLGFGCLRNS